MDLFGGSGFILIVCDELKWNVFLNEFDEIYVDVIVKRYINLRGSIDNCYLLRDGFKKLLLEIGYFNNINESEV